MNACIHRALALGLFVTMMSATASAQQKPASPTPAPAPAPAPGSSTLKPQPTAPTLAPYERALSQPSVNYRVEVQVSDRQENKVLTNETFTALVSNSSNSRISRI